MSNAKVLAFSTHHPQTSNPRRAKKQVRIIKKIRSDRGVWQFVSLRQLNGRYVWDKRDGITSSNGGKVSAGDESWLVKLPARRLKRNGENETNSLANK